MENDGKVSFDALCARMGGEVAWLKHNWRELMRDYAGQNIAISRCRVVASGDHYRETVALALERGWQNPFMAKLPRRERHEESRGEAERQTQQ